MIYAMLDGLAEELRPMMPEQRVSILEHILKNVFAGYCLNCGHDTMECECEADEQEGA